MIVLDVAAGGLDIAPGFGLRRLVGLVEQIKLKLRSEVRRHVHRGESRDLLAQHRARAMCDRLVMVMVDDIAQNQRGCRQPRYPPQRRKVGLHDEIAVALLPVGCGISRHRLHIDVVGEQIIAAVGFLVGAFEEILGLEALTDERALHVGEADHDRVDLAGGHGLLQLFQCQHAGHREGLVVK